MAPGRSSPPHATRLRRLRAPAAEPCRRLATFLIFRSIWIAACVTTRKFSSMQGSTLSLFPCVRLISNQWSNLLSESLRKLLHSCPKKKLSTSIQLRGFVVHGIKYCIWLSLPDFFSGTRDKIYLPLLANPSPRLREK